MDDNEYLWTQSLGHQVITEVVWTDNWPSLNDDEKYKEWYQMWLELTEPTVYQKECAKRCFTRWRQYNASKKYERFFCNVDAFLEIMPSELWCKICKEIRNLSQSCYIPLKFYFCRNNSLDVNQLIQSINCLGSWSNLNQKERKSIKKILNHSSFDENQTMHRFVFFVYSSLFTPLIK